MRKPSHPVVLLAAIGAWSLFVLRPSTVPALAESAPKPSSSSTTTTSTQPAPDRTQETKPVEPPKQQVTTSTLSAMSSGATSGGAALGVKFGVSGLKVNSGGSGVYTVGISVPPGIGGVAPSLSFVYTSQGESGLLGMGFGVSGLSAIHRCPKTVAQDGVLGGINFNTSDRFCLDGQRLMVVSGTYGGNGAEYRTELESFVRVFPYGSPGSGPAYFVVKTKAGETLEFGNTYDSRIMAWVNSAARVWALNKFKDSKGNEINIIYINDWSVSGEYRPDRIDYTSNLGNGQGARSKKVGSVYL